MGKDRVGTSFKPDKTFFQKLIYRSSNIKKSDAITVILHSFYFISDLLSDCLIFSIIFLPFGSTAISKLLIWVLFIKNLKILKFDENIGIEFIFNFHRSE